MLAEPIEDCLWRDVHGRPCLETKTPPDLERELGLPGGHIFHRDLSWPYARDGEPPGHNAAMALLQPRRSRWQGGRAGVE